MKLTRGHERRRSERIVRDDARGRHAARSGERPPACPDEPGAALVLGHGAAGGVTSRDLVAATDVARSEGVSVALVEQPYRVAGRRSPAPARQLDAAWTAVVDHLIAGELRGLPLVVAADLWCASGLPHRGGDRRRRGALPRVPAAAAAPVRGGLGSEPTTRARHGDGPDARRAGVSETRSAFRPPRRSAWWCRCRATTAENRPQSGGRRGASLAPPASWTRRRSPQSPSPRATPWSCSGSCGCRPGRSGPLVPRATNRCGWRAPREYRPHTSAPHRRP